MRGDTIAPRIAMRESGAKTDRLYLPPAHIEFDGQGGQIAMPGFGEGNTRTRIPVLPIELYGPGSERPGLVEADTAERRSPPACS